MSELLPIIVQQATETTAGLKSSISNSLSDVWNGVIGDRTAAWRLKRMIPIQNSVGDLLKENGLELDRDKIPEHYALRWFEEASKSEESPEITDIFAKLLVEAGSGNVDASRVPLLAIVSSMSSEDAKQFRTLVKNLIRKFESGNPSTNFAFIDPNADNKTEFSEIYGQYISLDTLSYLGLVRIENKGILTMGSGPQYEYLTATYSMFGEERIGVTREVTLTWLGLALANAVLPELNARRLARVAAP